ncbi:MAG: Fe-Mn family superoxide dismutase [bacterium]|nr:Fe-Mn family superoxide dismutase [bacterium]MDZ4295954.1 Fe-Mn family superoxide dismutase [Patescibacteria group bacterium]
MHQPKPISYEELPGISKRALENHFEKLYKGYVAKRNEIEERLTTADRSKAQATWSEYGELKRQETFAANGQILHEAYFAGLTGDGRLQGEIAGKITQDFGSVERWEEDFRAAGLAARGWVVLAYDHSDGKLHNFLCDAHNQGGVWGAAPLLILDVYEHAYFLDYGADRKSYLDAYMKLVDWGKVSELYERIKA